MRVTISKLINEFVNSRMTSILSHKHFEKKKYFDNSMSYAQAQPPGHANVFSGPIANEILIEKNIFHFHASCMYLNVVFNTVWHFHIMNSFLTVPECKACKATK